MRGSARPLLSWLTILALAACADRAPGSDSGRDSAGPVPAGADAARTPGAASTPAATPATTPATPPNTRDSHSGAPVVAGRPACARPVPVSYYSRGGVADEFIVTFGALDGANADPLIDSLTRRHGFTATHRYDGAFSGFSAKLPLTTLEAIRCEPAVTRISQVVVGGIGAVPPPGEGR